MAQVTLYLDEETERRLAQSAKRAKLSKSRYVAALIRERHAQEWPESILRMAGAAPDFPMLEHIRRDEGKDTPRKRLP